MSVRGKVSYPHVVSTLALVLALGGGVVYAADKIGSADIARDAIKSKHVKDAQIRGQDVDESSLGQVPAAAAADSAQTANTAQSAAFADVAGSAASADSVGGVTEQLVRGSVPGNTAVTDIADIDGLRIGIGCQSADGDGQIRARGSATGDRMTISGTFDNASTAADNVFFESRTNTSVQTFGLSGPPTAMSGTVTLRRPSGRVVHFDYHLLDATDGFGTTDDCFLQGFARSAG